MKDITAIGEVLIDLTQTGVNGNGVPTYAANPGGAPANLAVAASRLGAKTAFIGRVGNDKFGEMLRETLEKDEVDVSGMSVDPVQATTLAVVSVDASGERSFSFYRNPGADGNMTWADVPAEMLRDTKILHFGSLSLVFPGAREATMMAVEEAKQAGALISYDPNYRASLWPDAETAVFRMKEPLLLVDILKVSDEELPLLTGETDPEKGSAILASYGVKLIFVTLGADGAFYRMGEVTGRVPGIRVNVADTNGAGDTFFGAALSKLVQVKDLKDLSAEELHEIASYANKAAAFTTGRHGAIPAMPRAEELR